MRHCVQYALTYPSRLEAKTEPLDLFSVGKLSFAKPDPETFILLEKAFEAIKLGGAVPAVLNAANEEAVAAFLDKKIGFCDIMSVVCDTVDRFADATRISDVDGILSVSAESRKVARELIRAV